MITKIGTGHFCTRVNKLNTLRKNNNEKGRKISNQPKVRVRGNSGMKIMIKKITNKNFYKKTRILDKL